MAVLEGGFVEGDRMQAIVDGDLLKFEKAQGVTHLLIAPVVARRHTDAEELDVG